MKPSEFASSIAPETARRVALAERVVRHAAAYAVFFPIEFRDWRAQYPDSPSLYTLHVQGIGEVAFQYTGFYDDDISHCGSGVFLQAVSDRSEILPMNVGRLYALPEPLHKILIEALNAANGA